MRISDWSSDVCSSDLLMNRTVEYMEGTRLAGRKPFMPRKTGQRARLAVQSVFWATHSWQWEQTARYALIANAGPRGERHYRPMRSEERREGQESVRTCGLRWGPSHLKKQHTRV